VPLPGAGFRPPPPPPIKPYQALAVTPPPRLDDATYSAFRKQLADVIAQKDRAALAKLVTAQNFFWIQDKDLADKRKSGIDNLAKAAGLDAKDGSGWDNLLGFANDPTAAELPQQKGVFCAPADPAVDPKAFEALGKATQTDPSDWGYPLKDGLEVHAAAQANSPVIEKLGMILVRVLPDNAPPANPNEPFSCTSRHHPANPVLSTPRRCRRSAATSSATARMRAAGRSSVISAAPRNDRTRSSHDSHDAVGLEPAPPRATMQP